jgi:osmotically-inducible protein OsmY
VTLGPDGRIKEGTRMMDRDYDRARSGGRFDDDYGGFSRSPERDHSLSGARRAYTDPDANLDRERFRDDDPNRDWDPGRRGSRDYDERIYRADWDRDRVRYRDRDDAPSGRRMTSRADDQERFGYMGGGRDRGMDREYSRPAYEADYGYRASRRYEDDDDRGDYAASRNDPRFSYSARNRDWRDERVGYGYTGYDPEHDRGGLQYGRGEPTFERGGGDYGRRAYMGERNERDDYTARSARGTDYYATEARRSGFGEHTGRGPRGYQRSDDRIREDACERLTYRGDVDASDIDVAVANGEITLSGTVDNRWSKRAAEDAVEDISGVQEVHNRLRVRRNTSAAGDWRGERYAEAGYGRYERSDRGQDRIASSATATATTGLPGGTTTASRNGVSMGMDVVGDDQNSVGMVKETRDTTFLIDRTAQRDIWAPYSAVRTVTGNRVILTCAADEVDNQGWDNPPLMGGDADTTAATTPTT